MNNTDRDNDAIPDFADGYNWDGITGNDDNINTNDDFIPIVFEIPAPIDIQRAKVRITYDDSDPMGVYTNSDGQYFLPTGSGSLRLWTKDGNVARIGTSILNSGHYIPEGVYSASDFGFSPGTRTVTYYVEGLKRSETAGDIRILFEVQPDERTGFIAADAVRFTGYEFDVVWGRKSSPWIHLNYGEIQPAPELLGGVPGEAGGPGGFGGPPTNSGMERLVQPFTVKDCVINDPGTNDVGTISLRLVSNVTSWTNDYVLTETTPDSEVYADTNDAVAIQRIVTVDYRGQQGVEAEVVNFVSMEFGARRIMTLYRREGTNVFESQRLDIVVTMTNMPDPGVVDTLYLELTSSLIPGVTDRNTLHETSTNSLSFVSDDDLLTLRIERMTSRGSADVDDFTAMVSSKLLDVTEVAVDAIETGVDTLCFRTDTLHNQGSPPTGGGATRYVRLGSIWAPIAGVAPLTVDNILPTPAKIYRKQRPTETSAPSPYAPQVSWSKAFHATSIANFTMQPGMVYYLTDPIRVFLIVEDDNNATTPVFRNDPADPSSVVKLAEAIPGDVFIAESIDTPKKRPPAGIRDEVTVLKCDIAMDGNRDGNIDFDSPDDAKYLFWVNDDYDVNHWNQDESMWQEDDDPSPDGASLPPNCNDDYIGETEGSGALINPHNCRRDLEDFTRLQIRVDDNTANMSGITYFLKFENVSSGSPSVNIFAATDETLAYLQNGTVADQQIQEARLITIDSSEVPLPNGYIETGNQRSPFILEGKTAGKGDLTIIVKKNGNQIYKKAVTLELRPITKFYQVFRVATVGQNSTDVSAGYNSDFTSSDDYLLFVHGFNVNATDKAYWPGTVFKRLWWQGYKGHVGFFDWPCVLFSSLNLRCYDDSEFNAWRCGAALLDRIGQLNTGVHSGKVRLLAHSQGNVVAGEAFRLASGQVVHTYVATQTAVPADCYQSGLPAYVTVIRTPNVFVSYPQTGAPYLTDALSHVSHAFSYFNQIDWALTPADRIGTWEYNNGSCRPWLPLVGDYGYFDGDSNIDTYNPSQGDRFYREETTLVFPNDTFEIFSYGAEARTEPVGVQSAVTGFQGNVNLGTSFGYDGQHYSHSRQFRSNIVDERNYWRQMMRNCGFPLGGE